MRKILSARKYLIEMYYAEYGGWEDDAAGAAHKLLGSHMNHYEFASHSLAAHPN